MFSWNLECFEHATVVNSREQSLLEFKKQFPLEVGPGWMLKAREGEELKFTLVTILVPEALGLWCSLVSIWW